MKNKYVKEFMVRGLAFGALGPLVFGIVLMILGFCNVEIKLQGWEILLGIVSTYLLAFIQAGASVFEQIEEWSDFKSALIHMATIYVIYLAAYLVNNWIPFNWIVIAIFSGAVVATFLIIWLICYLVNRNYKKQLNCLIKKFEN